MQQYYEILGIDSDASDEEVKKAYRRAASKHHPDKGGDEEQFKKVQEAYESIMDYRKQPHTDWYDKLRDDDAIYEYWKEAAGRAYAWKYTDYPDEPEIINRSIIVYIPIDKLNEPFSKTVSVRNTPITIHIPPGQYFDDSTFFRMVKVNDKLDVVLTVKIIAASNDDYEIINSKDLVRAESITALDQLVGTEIIIPKYDKSGYIKVKIPKNVRIGAKIRLAGQGLPSGNKYDQTVGDIYVLITDIIPVDDISDEDLETLTKMRDKYAKQ